MKLNPFELGLQGFQFWRRNRVGNKIGRKLFPKITARREAKRAANKSGQAIPAEVVEESMFSGKKTYIGIATAAIGIVLGWFGLGECDPTVVDVVCQNADQLSARITASINEVITIGGLLLAAYGRAKAKPAA